jgi:phage tail-like protein
MPLADILRNFPYRLEIDEITYAGFSEVLIATPIIDAIDPKRLEKLSGSNKYRNVTLKRGSTTSFISLDLLKWHADEDDRRKAVIVVQDEAGIVIARFVITNAYPVRYELSDPNPGGDEVMIELLELANEGVERLA